MMGLLKRQYYIHPKKLLKDRHYLFLYICLVKTGLKKLLIILLSFAVMAYSLQVPCSAINQQEQAACIADDCCDDAPGDEEEDAGAKKGYDSCCTHTVLSMLEMPQFEYHRFFSYPIKTGFVNQKTANSFAKDFWQPPRYASHFALIS